MDKKYFEIPFVLLSDSALEPGTGNEGGDGSGQGHIGPHSFGEWEQTRHLDIDENGSVNFDDYCQWWTQQSNLYPKTFTPDAWVQLNPGTPYPGTGN